MKFNIAKYQKPDPDEIDWEVTRKNFSVFVNAYQISRERVGQTRMPRVTQSFSLIPPSTINQGCGQSEVLLIQHEDALEEFNELHNLFVQGYSAISHVKPDKSERRRKIFFLRYFNNLTLKEISERIFFGRDVIIKESKEAMLQFCTELELVVYKSEIRKG
ncbi:ArpU family transcriptional regulator [Enterococcus sp. 669A]|uniref:ArpU family transcriptional regulator n=1 Tax=Candidatus Enterococcus moelleringii TaxID=2815325 RepID=UPI001F610CD2|nr:ArpU family transcriptional regulator [Enterococcus sp. 669A]